MVTTAASKHRSIATLLAEGLGDTIRVSLTEAPERVTFVDPQAIGLRKTMVEYVACPSCRCLILRC